MQDFNFEGKITKDTAFCYVWVKNSPDGGMNFWLHSNNFGELAEKMACHFLIATLEEAGKSEALDKVDCDSVSALHTLLPDLQDIFAVKDYSEFVKEHSPLNVKTSEQLGEFAMGLSLIALRGGAIEFEFCENILSVLAFLKDYSDDTTVEEICDLIFDGAEIEENEI